MADAILIHAATKILEAGSGPCRPCIDPKVWLEKQEAAAKLATKSQPKKKTKGGNK